jgi:radical SAM superfamily enzyme
MKKETNQTHKRQPMKQKTKKREVFIYFMAYKKTHNMYHNMLDNTYITLKVGTRAHISFHKSYDFMNWK